MSKRGKSIEKGDAIDDGDVAAGATASRFSGIIEEHLRHLFVRELELV
jgi:hypothetical protein